MTPFSIPAKSITGCMFTANLVIQAQICNVLSCRKAKFPTILNQYGQNDLEGQGHWLLFWIPTESIPWCMSDDHSDTPFSNWAQKSSSALPLNNVSILSCNRLLYSPFSWVWPGVSVTIPTPPSPTEHRSPPECYHWTMCQSCLAMCPRKMVSLGTRNSGKINWYYSRLSLSHALLTHCGLVTPYGSRDLGQHWLR